MQTTKSTKKELKHWIDRVDDDITLYLLQSLKKAPSLEDWFWNKISSDQKQQIIEGLKKAKESNNYTQQELWEKIEFQYSRENIEEFESEDLRQALKQGMEDVKAGRIHTSKKVWEEIDHRRKKRAK